jgi:amino acid adenylation domain-containing protein
MSDIAGRIDGLPPEKRALLARILRQTPARFNAFPLSFAQRRLWFLDRMVPVSASTTSPPAYAFAGAGRGGPAPAPRRGGAPARGAAQQLHAGGGRAGAGDRPAAPVELPLDDLSALPPERAARSRCASRRGGAHALRPGARRAAAGRAGRLAADEHLLLLTAHHIVTDGWSVAVMFRELATLYAAFAAGRPSPLPELALQYADFAAWQREHLRGERMDRLAEHWTRRMEGAPALLELPTDRPRPPEATFAGRMLRFELPAALVPELHALARRESASLFMVLTAAFSAVLARWSGQEQVVVGTPVANRGRAETEGMIGLFVNTLAIRADLSGGPTLRELLKRVRDTALEAFAHQELPFEKLVELLKTGRSLGHHPVFQVMLALQNTGDAPEIGGMRLEPLRLDAAGARFDLSLSVRERDGGIAGVAEYATDLFDGTTVERLIDHLRIVLEAMAADPDTRVDEVELLRGGERERVLRGFNRTTAPAPDAPSLHALFERAADAWPRAAAGTDGAESLTYAEVEAQANRLAHHLRALGVGPESRVGVCVERGPRALAALLGVLKAGGAYVPLDPSYPADRLRWMLEECGRGVIVAGAAVADRLPEHAGRLVLLEDPAIGARPAERPAPAPGAGPDSLAYVIYTSGSTGRPKGVLVPHGCAVGLVAQSLPRLDVRPGDRVAQTASLNFDLSVLQIFAALAGGAAACFIPAETLASPAELVETLRALGTTHVMATPAVLEMIPADSLPGVRTICSGGDRCPPEVAARLAPRRRFLNAYGPTETTIYATAWAGGRTAPASFPSAAGGNLRAYVLDSALRPVPVAIPGELLLGGAGVTRGYHARPALTAERYVPTRGAACPARGCTAPATARAGAPTAPWSSGARGLPGQDPRLPRRARRDRVRPARAPAGERRAGRGAHRGRGEAAGRLPGSPAGRGAGPGGPARLAARAAAGVHDPRRLVRDGVVPAWLQRQGGPGALPAPEGAAAPASVRRAPRRSARWPRCGPRCWGWKRWARTTASSTWAGTRSCW